MQSILVVTSTPGFGELIQQALEETGAYRVLLVDSSLEAITCARNIPFALTILDFDLPDQHLDELARRLKVLQAGMYLIAIPPDNNPQHSLLSQSPLDSFLNKPFYLPDLLETVSQVLSRRGKPAACRAEPSQPPVPPAVPKNVGPSTSWLQDVDRAAQHLTQLTLESSAQAALILYQAELWAYAGQLDQPTAQELATLVSGLSMDVQPACTTLRLRDNAMVRVVHLNTTGSEYLVYITALRQAMVLAVAFEVETPLSTIRTQANTLARCLVAPNNSQLKSTLMSTASHPARYHLSQPVRTAPAFTENDLVDEQEDDDDDGDESLPISIPLLLDDILPPYPTSSDSQPPHASTRLDHPTPPAVKGFDHGGSIPPGQAAVEGVLRPVTPALHSLYYLCLMIPRLPQHLLVGKLARHVAELLGQLCLAYGWHLERISIRPEYAQWVVNVPPVTSPSYLMRILRRKTSRRIFESFPELYHENPSGDFWAPGYLIMSGSQSPAPHLVQDFIRQTRQFQGLHTQLQSKA